MRRLLLALPLAALSMAVGFPAIAHAQTTKNARGTLTAMTTDSLTVKVGTTDMTFTIDDKLHVEAPGAGTKSRAAAASGKGAPKLSELLHTGDAVQVSYNEAGGTRHASAIRKIASPGSGGVPGNTSAGTVTAISASSITISGSSGGGSKFTQTFAIGPETKVIGKGVGTAASKTGGRAPATDLVANGDQVSVSYKPGEGTLHATEVRVTNKGTAK